MPNAIKYNTSAETLALKKGNFYIGTGDVGKGPTSSTGYYNGITPPSGGYTIYLNKETGGPSIYTVTTEAQMVSLTNTIGAQSFTTSGQCLNWFATQTDKMIFNRDYEPIVTDGLVLNVDAGFTPSYSQSGTTWYDMSSSGNNGTLTNGPTFNSANGGSIVFDGVDDKIFCPVSNTTNFTTTDNFSVETFCYATSRSSSGMIPIVERYYWGTVGKGGYGVRLTNYSSIKPSFFITGNVSGVGQTDYGVEATTTWQTNTWYHIVGTKNSSGTLKIYINGVLENTVITNNIIPLTSDDIPLMIAARGDTQDQYSNSRISVVRIYRKELSAAEVLQNYNAQKGRFGL
jgi:hypothetical protein